jgi:DNA-binding transcriptional MerR regulator
LFARPRDSADRERGEGTIVPLRSSGRSAFQGHGHSSSNGKKSSAARTVAMSHARLDEEDTSSSSRSSGRGLLQQADLATIEATYADGITAPQIVEVFTSRGVKFSEASFRKYVQQGLLPRSRRVGRKGKYRGSLGMYPAKTIRRINSVKEWMADGYTIEEIQGQFLLYTDLVENLSEGLGEMWQRVAVDLDKFTHESTRKALSKELLELRKDSEGFVRRVGELTRRVASPRGQNFRRTGAAGSAEDLL